jgi:hypothetical protein
MKLLPIARSAQFRLLLSRSILSLIVLSLSLAWLQPIADAAQITNRSLSLSSYDVSATADHAFKFSFPINLTLGSLRFAYCDSPLDMVPCVPPSGLDTSAATLTNQTGETGFVIDSQTNNTILLTRTAASSSTDPNEYVFSGVINPDQTGTFYVRISAYDSEDASGSTVGYGAVAQALVKGVSISTEVPPILEFCVAQSIPGDCTTANGSLVALGELSSNNTAVGSSQMMGGTNAEFGYAIVAYGTTLTSGNNVIPALSAPTESAPGNSQFGINLRANTDPAVGTDPIGLGIASPAGAYNQPNRFKFSGGEVLASTPDPTKLRKFTVSYVANVSPNQAPGVYSTTLTYICTATF